MTTTFMTNEEYAKYKDYANLAAFVAAEGYPSSTALDQFREDVFGFMIKYIGSENARSTYDSYTQFQLRNIEYRGVELMVSGEIAKAKIENYIQNAIVTLFGKEDREDMEVVDNAIHRGVVE